MNKLLNSLTKATASIYNGHDGYLFWGNDPTGVFFLDERVPAGHSNPGQPNPQIWIYQLGSENGDMLKLDTNGLALDESKQLCFIAENTNNIYSFGYDTDGVTTAVDNVDTGGTAVDIDTDTSLNIAFIASSGLVTYNYSNSGVYSFIQRNDPGIVNTGGVVIDTTRKFAYLLVDVSAPLSNG